MFLYTLDPYPLPIWDIDMDERIWESNIAHIKNIYNRTTNDQLSFFIM